MQDFFIQNRVLIVEERLLKDRACKTLGWSNQQWYYRVVERTALSTAERIILEQVLTQIRQEVAAGELDLHKYNTL